jgi:hypothetical protein
MFPEDPKHRHHCNTKRVEGAGAPRDETMVSMERNERRSKEGDAAGLNTSLLLGASKR